MSCRPLGRWLFGKIPGQGDFVHRGLDDYDMRDGLDRWLTEDLAAAKAAYADFDARYDRAPAWNFVDCDADGRWSGGALCASIDRVGRRYPVVLAAPAEDAAHAAAVSGACLSALGDAIAQGWDADALHAAPLDSAPPPQDAGGWRPHAAQWALLGEDDTPVVTLDGRFPSHAVSKMLELAP